jgi:hypothetical protein
MKTIRTKFVKDFSEELALKLEAAAEDHDSEVHSNRGDDPFKWVLLICIGYQCFEIDIFRKAHNITEASYEELKEWIKKHGELGTHNGDCDYLSILSGAYGEYMPSEEAQ